MRRNIIAANWKMNQTLIQAQQFVQQLPVLNENVDVIVCAPFTVLSLIAEDLRVKNIALGAQNVHWEPNGAYTGEISVLMLKDVGVKYVIVGHSERRTYFNETNGTVNRKVHAVLSGGLIPIICVGENLQQHEANQTNEIVKEQIQGALKGINQLQIKDIVIAYEPIWAIGTGKTSTGEYANAVILEIRRCIAGLFGQEVADQVQIQYGGSVTPENISGFLSLSDIDGALVGGASLQPDTFMALLKGAIQ